MKSYEYRIKMLIEQLSDRLTQFKGDVIDCSQLFLSFGFDAMGDVAFGKSIDMVSNRAVHSSVRIVLDGMVIAGLLTPLPWLVRLLTSVPALNRDWHILMARAESHLQGRMATDTSEPDVS